MSYAIYILMVNIKRPAEVKFLPGVEIDGVFKLLILLYACFALSVLVNARCPFIIPAVCVNPLCREKCQVCHSHFQNNAVLILEKGVVYII
jgi:hypothetical protein